MQRLASAIALALAILGVPGPATAAGSGAPPFGMWVELSESCFRGAGPPGARLSFELRTADGVLSGRTRATVGGDGDYFACIEGGAGALLPTDVLIGRLGDVERRFRLPALAPSVDRASGVLRGRARPGELVDVTILVDREFRGVASGLADAQGRYRIDLGRRQVGGTVYRATIHRGRDRVTGIGRAISVDLWAGSALVSGIAGSPDGVRLVLRAPDGSWRGRADQQIIDSPPSGDFGTFFADRRRQPVAPRPGDRIAWPRTGVDITVPRVAVRGLEGSTTVQGRCVPRGRFELQMDGRREDGGSWEREVRGKADDAGRFRVTLDAAMTLQIGDDLRLTCSLPGGDSIRIAGTSTARGDG